MGMRATRHQLKINTNRLINGRPVLHNNLWLWNRIRNGFVGQNLTSVDVNLVLYYDILA